jgi:membrane protease YdiL (CAAX protease family)
MPIALTPEEKRNGCAYLAISLFLLPGLISLAGDLMHLDAAATNLIYYIFNLAFVLWIFRKFLLGNVLVALDRIFPVIWYGILGYLGYQTLGELVSVLIRFLSPGFVNYNDASVGLMVRQSPMLALSIIIFVPIAEETLYRGLIFRGLFGRKPAFAYLASILIFAAIHVVGYVGVLSPVHLLLSFVQYLPAGYCLCFVYHHSGTLVCPILVHTAINAMAVHAFVR